MTDSAADPFYPAWSALLTKAPGPATDRFTHPDAHPEGPARLAQAWSSHPHAYFGEAGAPEAFWPGDEVYAYSHRSNALTSGLVLPISSSYPNLVTVQAASASGTDQVRSYRPELVAHRDRVHERSPEEHQAAAEAATDPLLRAACTAAAQRSLD